MVATSSASASSFHEVSRFCGAPNVAISPAKLVSVRERPAELVPLAGTDPLDDGTDPIDDGPIAFCMGLRVPRCRAHHEENAYRSPVKIPFPDRHLTGPKMKPERLKRAIASQEIRKRRLCRLLAPGMPYLEPVENSPCSRRVCPPGRKSLNDKNCALRWRGHRLQTPASILAIRVPHRQKMHIFFDGYFSPYIRPAFP